MKFEEYQFELSSNDSRQSSGGNDMSLVVAHKASIYIYRYESLYAESIYRFHHKPGTLQDTEPWHDRENFPPGWVL